MKKLLVLSLTLLSAAVFTACAFPTHEHVKSDWKFSANQHWRVPECNRKDCAIEDVVYDLGDHIDADKDGFCDVCSYRPLSPSLGMNWHYSDSHHWRLPEGEETFAVVYGYNPHVDEDKNNICDICGYQYSIDTETDHMQ